MSDAPHLRLDHRGEVDCGERTEDQPMRRDVGERTLTFTGAHDRTDTIDTEPAEREAKGIERRRVEVVAVVEHHRQRRTFGGDRQHAQQREAHIDRIDAVAPHRQRTAQHIGAIARELVEITLERPEQREQPGVREVAAVTSAACGEHGGPRL